MSAHNEPQTVADSIRACAVKYGTHNGLPTFRGLLRVHAPWGKYTRSVGVGRMTREDALQDAVRARSDWISVNQLP